MELTLQEEVFMDQLRGFINTGYPNYACKLIYGSKQASRAWFNQLSDRFSIEFFVRQSLVDNSLFVLHMVLKPEFPRKNSMDQDPSMQNHA